MTREEILACLTDRPCTVCKFNSKEGCGKWNCIFEEEPEDKSVNAAMDEMKSIVDRMIDDGLKIVDRMIDDSLKMIEKRREIINENT